MEAQPHYPGGCSCGAVRYRADGDPIDAGYCHCRLCQRTSGAPVLAWATFPVAAFVYTTGEPAIYRSSPRGQREFCGRCGTQIAFRASETPTTVDLNFVTLDEPDAFEPEYHIWTGSQRPWLHITDPLPRYVDAGPDADS